MTTQPPAPSSQRAIQAGLRNPRLMQAALALHDNQLHEAEPLLKQHLHDHPLDVAAIRMLAELASRIGRPRDAETLLRRALEIAPEFGAARANLATVLYRQNRPADAIAQLNHLIEDDPDHVGAANLKAAALGRIGEFNEALELYEAVLKTLPRQPKIWMSYGHMLKTVGRTADGIAAYRKALDLSPHLGEVWWSLANLKTVTFTSDDVAAMQTALTASDLSDEDRFHLDFALGKAMEDAKDYPSSFYHYAAGNALRRKALDYDVTEIERFTAMGRSVFTADFFVKHAGQGCEAPDAIFIVGMPRAGSTLVEQILSSHSQVEGTSELADIPNLTRQVSGYPQRLDDITPERLKSMGEAYLERTRIQRKSDKPFFIDKLPNNWAHAAFIHLILPNAKIIDARRHPLACCFSNFKQHYARGQAFSYDLADMGRYYAAYVRYMAHLDAVLPGRVHRVIHEHLVEDTEHQIRALLTACGLGFEDSCLRFYETDRAIRTPSSEQVRRPISSEGGAAWKGFEAWLDPLKTALGPVLDGYPEPPKPLLT